MARGKGKMAAARERRKERANRSEGAVKGFTGRVLLCVRGAIRAGIGAGVLVAIAHVFIPIPFHEGCSQRMDPYVQSGEPESEAVRCRG